MLLISGILEVALRWLGTSEDTRDGGDIGLGWIDEAQAEAKLELDMLERSEHTDGS